MDKLLHIIKRLIPRKIFKALQPAYHFIFSFSAALFYRFPSEKLIVIGITGTTGKTTSAYLISKMLKAAGHKVGYTSTAMFSDGEKEWLNDRKMTMPGRFFTQKILRQMVKHKCQYAIIETTSEGIRQFRHRFINYDSLIFTGLYPEHIESHGSFVDYKKAKGELFKHLKRGKIKYADNEKCVCSSDSGIKRTDLNRVKKIIIANGDDKEVKYFLDFWAEERMVYTKKGDLGLPKAEEIKYSEVFAGREGTSFFVNNRRPSHNQSHRQGGAGGASSKINLRLLGEFNAANAMVAVCVGLSEGLDMKKIKEGLENVAGVPGRFEKIEAGQNFTVIVDYAFEPKAVAKLYETVELIPRGKIIHVLGSAGGGRDKARRPKLGVLAGRHADYIIITNEDPYDENPQTIIDEVARGVKSSKKVFKILDRREAIRKALSLAEENDIVLITGKGSEQAICAANGEKIKWDDREVAKEELERITHNA
ncbi:MAG: UDP-N-acetylmuramyl-tripeptide synthetase [Patescibacteria group bacterium]|nr:UDP-N-acetylmuramyl-tripeptide synthetase [Patescibacteria group bacterium]